MRSQQLSSTERIRQAATTAGVIALVAIAVACSSSPDSVIDETAEASPEAVQDADEPRQRERLSDQIESRPSTAPPGGHWWGQIQDRADWAYDDLETEIVDCLERLGDSSRVREIAVWTVRDGTPGTPYEIREILTHPPNATADEPCIERVASDYVDAVGSAFWDDFDTYIATFVHRGDAEGACDGDDVEHAVCADLAQKVADNAEGSATDTECDEKLVDRVQEALREQRRCWSPSRYSERMQKKEDDPIARRALLFGELRVENSRPRVILRYNQPWVASMARCVVEDLDVELPSDDVAGACRSQLSNRSVVLWDRPTFFYIYD